MRDAFICDAIRTPIGRYGGGLASVRVDDLAAIPLTALQARNTQVDWSAVDDVFMGCANQGRFSFPAPRASKISNLSSSAEK
jgi:acetyl-CoA acetyltransferase